MLFMVSDRVTSFLHLKDVTFTRKQIRRSLRQEFFSAMAESWKKLKTSNVFSLFIARS